MSRKKCSGLRHVMLRQEVRRWGRWWGMGFGGWRWRGAYVRCEGWWESRRVGAEVGQRGFDNDVFARNRLGADLCDNWLVWAGFLLRFFLWPQRGHTRIISPDMSTVSFLFLYFLFFSFLFFFFYACPHFNLVTFLIALASKLSNCAFFFKTTLSLKWMLNIYLADVKYSVEKMTLQM